jgi:hypothetical protein
MTGETLLRPFLVVTGCLAVMWCAVTLPSFCRSHPVEFTSSRILGGAAYTSESLAELLTTIDALESAGNSCAPRALQSAAIILLRVMEEGFSPDQLSLLDRRVEAVNAAIRRSLACAPADPFLWIVLYSVESARNGFRPEYLNYVRESYHLGPHEGWIAVRRNRVVLAIFQMLPHDIADMALGEFAELIQNRLYDEAVANLLGPGWAIRDQLLARLDMVDERERTAFAARLYGSGVNLAVPGVTPPTQRPWR